MGTCCGSDGDEAGTLGEHSQTVAKILPEDRHVRPTLGARIDGAPPPVAVRYGSNGDFVPYGTWMIVVLVRRQSSV
jgi:hypothetical protein